jgi:protein-tyrosine phosphatase
MPEVLDWRRNEPPRLAADRAVRVLAAAGVVAFPTETVYGLAASALAPGAVDRLVHSKGRPDDKPLTLALAGAAEAVDWLPGLSPLGRRLARRCWPGPLTLVGGEGVAEGLAGRLPDAVRRRVSPVDTLGLRVPAHEAVLQVLRRLPGPLVLTSANRSGEPEAVTAEDVVRSVGEGVDLVIDDGPSHFGRASTVVRVAGASWCVLREGVVSAATLERLGGCMVVFVCTGNTCRSPLAEGLFKKLLTERLGCRADELPGRGLTVLSAGLAAGPGGPAAPEAVETARDLGADLSGHSSRPLTPELAAQADFLVAMTRGHLRAVADHFERLGARPRLLCRDGQDVPDPIGGDREVYRQCAAQIVRSLEGLAAEVLR